MEERDLSSENLLEARGRHGGHGRQGSRHGPPASQDQQQPSTMEERDLSSENLLEARGRHGGGHGRQGSRHGSQDQQQASTMEERDIALLVRDIVEKYYEN
ncbi:hypothetical protein H0H93_002027, partial [Arthromyces matolae]